MAKKIGIIVLLCFSLCVGGVSAFANEGHDETDTQTLIETQHPVSSVLFRQDGADIQQSTDEGKTWQSYSPIEETVYFTYDEFSAWIENETENIQKLVDAGEWTEAEATEALEYYDEILKSILEGKMVGKRASSSDDQLFFSMPNNAQPEQYQTFVFDGNTYKSISRSILDFANMMELFQEYDVEFVSSTEKFDTSTPMGRAMLNICIVFAQLERETIQKRVTDAYYSRCLKGFHMSGQAPYGFDLEPTVVENIRTKMMVADPIAANHVRLMFEMYAEPETSFGDITRYFEERGIKVYGKSLTRSYLSQLLRNPVYAQADLEMYEFFKSQGTVVVNDAADFAGTNGCYLYQGRDVKEDKDKSLKDQILVIAPHEGFVSADVWLRCRKKLMTNTTFQNGRKARNTWLAGKIKCGKCGYALKTTHNPSGYEYLRCSKRADHKGCPGCGTLRKTEFEQFIFTAMGEKFREFKLLRGGEEKANPKITAYQVELAQVEAEIEKLLDTLTGANATLLAYANKKIEDLDNRRKTLSKAIADLSVETLSSQQIELLSGYLDDWENISFEDKRKAADGLISSISATSDYVKIEWKI